MSDSLPPSSFFDLSWLVPAVGTALIAALIAIGSYYLRRWCGRRGTTLIYIGDREPCEFITRGKWAQDRKRILQSAPRFMEFRIPLTIENRREQELTIRIRNVWFSEGRPEIRKDGWKLPGSSLEPTGLRVENAAGEIVDPVAIAANGIMYLRIVGTATSPVCHSKPFEDWRYLFVDWITSPVKVAPLIQEIQHGKSVDPNIEPTFALPSHYPQMQSAPGNLCPEEVNEMHGFFASRFQDRQDENLQTE